LLAEAAERAASPAWHDLVERMLPGALAAQEAVRQHADDADFAEIAYVGAPGWKQAIEIAVRASAALELADARACQHALAAFLDPDPEPDGPPLVAMLSWRLLLCRPCLRAIVASGGDPSPGDASRCDWCGSTGHTELREIVTSTGPILVHGFACRRCVDALLPGAFALPKGWG